ncbi:MAG: hypothetical protein RLZZ22_676 [Pseudomonadota bacterium]|jgi:Ca2+-binding EF-hand superfamily protein
MSSIGSVSSSNWSNTQALQGNRQARMQERLFQKADADGSGGVDSTELQTLLDKAAKKTGTSSNSSAADVLSQSDSNKDGSLSSDELDSVMKSMFPPPSSTQEFLQARGTTSGSGSAEESSEQASSESSQALQASGATGKAHGHGGMPPPPPPAGGVDAANSASQSSDSADLDPLDTNEDGVVSAAERATASAASSASTAIQNLFKSADADADGSLNATEIGKLAQQLTEQYSRIASSDFGPSTGSTINVTA